MKNNINFIKKQIIYRCSHSSIKETDILYRNYFINKIDKFNKDELKLIVNLLSEFSDIEIYKIISSKIIPNIKYKSLINKIIHY